MEYSGNGAEHDIQSESIISKPIAELLQDPAEVARLWPEYDLTDQIEAHANNVAVVHSVLDQLPVLTSLEQAITTEHLSETEVTTLYNTLTNVLDNSDYQRLVLYLPFELLPNAGWKPENIILRDSVNRFKTSYMLAWHNLLTMHDVRANFIDGDVLEDAYWTGNVPRVVKAAHLLPELLTRGLISEEHVAELLTSPDPLLVQSIHEGLSEYYGTRKLKLASKAEPHERITQARSEWLQQLSQEAEISQSADQIAAVLTHDETLQSLTDVLLEMSDSGAASQAFIEGVYRAIMQSEPKTADYILRTQLPHLEFLLQSTHPQIQDRAVSALRRLCRADLLPEDELLFLGISLPNLAGSFSENLSEIEEEVTFLKNLTEQIETHPFLKSVLYPVAVVGGSKLKGYGKVHSDVDVSVFIKPDVLTQAKEYIREEIHTMFTKGGVSYDPIEYWLEEKDNRLAVHTFTEPDLHVADEFWTHILFGGAWIGNEQTIKNLQQNLLPTYFHTTNVSVHGINKRMLYLERLEQDVLQYRLLHKGYERHYPLIDSDTSVDKSVFWDPGYRKLATKLFVSHVFLPKVD